MLCFEVFCNGKKLCTAGVGEFGVLHAILTWVSHEPEKLKRWAAEGVSGTKPKRLELNVSGLGSDDSDSPELLRWVESPIVVGDEIHICVVETPNPDPPASRHQDNPEWVEKQKKEYVRKTAKEFGWEIASEADSSQESGGS